MTAERPAAAIVYLDVDDEITSAATRIRDAAETPRRHRPARAARACRRRGSISGCWRARRRPRRASSRSWRPRRSTRALAASAGLPAFASVAEYEDALAQDGPDGGEDVADGESGTSGPGQGAVDRSDSTAGTSGAGQLAGWWATDPADTAPRPSRASIGGPPGAAGGGVWPRAGSGIRGHATTARGPAGAGGAATAAGAIAAGGASGTGPTAAGAGSAGSATSPGPRATAGVRPRSAMTETLVLPVPDVRAEPRRRRVSRLVIAVVTVLIVLLVAGGVAGWLFLPTATVTVSARVDPVGPLQFTVRADPLEVTQDVAQGIVPAEIVTYELNVSQEFPATGKKVSETKAAGAVQWTNCDPTRAYTIPADTIVRTTSGDQFTTGDAVFLPVAILSGNPPTISCQSRDVAVDSPRVRARKATSTRARSRSCPPTTTPSVIRVTNPDAPSGGTHTETKIVAQKDVDGAMATLYEGTSRPVHDPARRPVACARRD